MQDGYHHPRHYFSITLMTWKAQENACSPADMHSCPGCDDTDL